MKDLIDELHKLDKEEYKVSEDFSKKVMKKIKRENSFKIIKYVASVASVACVLGLSVFFANKSGVLDRLISAAGRSQSAMSAVDYMPSQAGEKNNDMLTAESYYDKIETGSNVNEAVNVEEAATENTLSDSQEAVNEKKAVKDTTKKEETGNQETEVSTEPSAEITDATEEQTNGVMYASQEKERTYAKQLSKEEYLKEIADVLKENNYKYTITENGIDIESDEINEVYNVLEEYTDIVITYLDGHIQIKLKE